MPASLGIRTWRPSIQAEKSTIANPTSSGDFVALICDAITFGGNRFTRARTAGTEHAGAA